MRLHTLSEWSAKLGLHSRQHWQPCLTLTYSTPLQYQHFLFNNNKISFTTLRLLFPHIRPYLARACCSHLSTPSEQP
jgi:hypothetical protein